MSNSTYADRITAAVEDEKSKKAFQRKKNVKMKLNDIETRYAKAMIDLKSNPDFKVFMEFESKIIGERMGDAFKLPSTDLLDTTDYACRMAFNHGRYYQMKYFMNSRNLLQKLYINEKQLEVEEDNGEN